MKLPQPGRYYYIWLRWLTRTSKRVSPPDPKPWRRRPAPEKARQKAAWAGRSMKEGERG